MRIIIGFFRTIAVFILTVEAKAVLKRYHPRVVFVAGGVGKTLAKSAVYTSLAKGFFVRRSEKSHGSDLSIPLAILGVSDGRGNPFQWMKNFIEGFFLLVLRAPYPEWLVLEASAERPGDIVKVLSWIVPDVVVATRFPEMPSRVEFYESPEAVIEEDLAPVGRLNPGGALIVNADDERARAAIPPPGVRVITFGLGEADVRAERFHADSHVKMPSGISFDVHYGSGSAHVSLPGVAGAAHIYPVLAGISVAVSAGIPLEAAASAFEAHISPPGRMRLIAGMRGSVIIDDSYNASPVATGDALAVLADIPHAGRRIAILGDMLELGTFSVDEHRRIGVLALDAADILVTVGVRAHDIAYGAREAGMLPEQVFECENPAEAASHLLYLIAPGDVVLIKGSRSMRMERVVKSVMAEPEKAAGFLVRQGTEDRLRR